MTANGTDPNPFTLVEGCRYGRFLVPPTDAYVGRALQEYGEYSEAELDVLLSMITNETRVVVAGANMGSLVVPLARHAWEVVAFEPQRWMSQLLAANVVLNGLLNVRTYWAALGNKPGLVTIPMLRPDMPNNFGAFEIEAVQDVPGDLVPVYKLDNVPDIAMGLLTIDVEGMELDVLQGAEQTIAKCRPIVYFEADRALKRGAVFDWFRARNYSLHWHRTPLFNPKNFKGKPEDLWGNKETLVIAENVLALPNERGIKALNFPPVLEL